MLPWFRRVPQWSPSETHSRRSYMKRTSDWLWLRVVCPVFLLLMALSAIPAQAQTFAYVADPQTSTVSVIDTADNIVVATITVGNGPYGLAFSPDGTRAYVANSQSSVFPNPGTVSVIDTASNTVTGTIIVGVNPLGVAITPDGRRAYVTNGGDFTVSVIDTASNTVTATVAVGAIPFWLAITPDGTRAYVANGADG